MKQARIIIRGMVQGVFFRAFARNHAINQFLNGYARNLDDGSL